MASYGPVLNDERYSEGLETVDSLQPSTKSGVHHEPAVYVQLPLDEDAEVKKVSRRSLGLRDRVSGLCVHPLLLVGLAFFFFSATLSVGLLYHYSRVEHGLANEINSHRYGWLYGPTAVVVLAQVVWRVVDLKTKETMPWHELAHGPASTDKPIFLEYISPAILPNIWKSIKNRHWPVTTTIAGHALLLLATVFVTGLFTLEQAIVAMPNMPLRRTHLDASGFSVSTLDASPALLSLAIQTQNLSYPKGTSANTVVPVFESDFQAPQDTITEAVVRGIKISMDCEPLEVKNASTKYLPWISARAPQFLINVTTPSCNIINARIGTAAPFGDVKNPNNTQLYQGWMRNHVCNTGLDTSLPWGMPNTRYQNDTSWLNSLDRTLDDRILVSMIDFGLDPQTMVGEPPHQWVKKLTAVLCKPSYSISDYRVGYSGNASNSRIDLVKGTNETLSNMYPGDISKALRKVFNDYGHLYIGLGGDDYQFIKEAAQPFVQMMSLLHGGENANFTLKDLVNPDVLKTSAEALLTGTMTQVLHQKAMSAMSDSPDTGLTGTVLFKRDRLHVKALSAGVLCGCFSVLLLLSIVLLVILPQKPELNGEAGSTVVVADALQSNSDLVGLFRQTNPRKVKETTKSMRFFAHPHLASGTLRIDVVARTDEANVRFSWGSKPDGHSEIAGKWWQPATSRSWYTGLAVAFCAILISLLELIQQLSDKRNGFINIRPGSTNSTILAQYVPAAIALTVTWMYTDIEKMVATFAPFTTLKKGWATASRTVALDYHAKSGPHVFWKSIVNRHFALATVLVTTFVASFLTIIIPGLYSRVGLPAATDGTVVVADRFSVKHVDLDLDDRRAGMMLNLVTYYNIDYPAWSYDNLAFPRLRLQNAESALPDIFGTSSARLRTRTTAIRPRLTCQSIAAQTEWKGKKNASSVEGTAYFPWSMCSNPPADRVANGTTPWSTLAFLANDTITSSKSYFLGKAQVMSWNTQTLNSRPRNYVSLDNGEDGLLIYPQRMPLPEWGCPSLAFTLGTASFNNDKRNSTANMSMASADMNTIICWQQLQTVETDLTLDYPSMTIAKDAPPKPDESTAKWLKNPSDSQQGTAFQFAIVNMFHSFSNPNVSSSDWSQGDSADRFTQALVHMAKKEDGLGVKDLAGVANSGKYVELVQRLYGRYMAQAVSNNMRVATGGIVPDLAVTDVRWTATASPVIVPTPSVVSSVINSRPGSNSTAGPTTWITPSFAPSRTLTPAPTPSPTTRSQQLQRRADGVQGTLPATLTRTGLGAQYRLKQNRAPKIALQALLSFMIVGAIVTKLLLHTKKTLQCEPYSIAGRATLVANGNMLDTMQDGSAEHAAFGERRYNLGWWEDKERGKRYGIVAKT